MYKQSFDPIISPEPRVLILGSLPGDLSLKMNQYYGHPRNRFWQILFKIFNVELSDDYQTRKQIILQHHLALWDVANSAVRKGSMDVNMKNEIPNNIEGLLMKYPTIERIIFNGKKSEKLFWKYFDKKSSIRYISMPSTSPANAQYSLQKLVDYWKNAIILNASANSKSN